MDMQGIAIPDIIITAKHTVWAILHRNGLSATMRRMRIAAVTKKMTGFADSGGQNRNCVQPLVISMPRTMRTTANRTLRLWKPCWRIGMRRMNGL